MLSIIASLIGAILASVAIIGIGGIVLWAACEALDGLF
jgi:hypothetical protein